jgi:multiple sugar transport system substrate-binding protein
MSRSAASLRLAVALAGCLVVTACGQAASPSPSSGGASTAPSAGASGGASPSADARQVELRFANWFYQGPMKEVYDEYTASFLAQEPRVTGVRVEETPFVRYHDVMNVQLAAGNQPNMAWINASVGPQYVHSGRLLDLRPYVEAVPDFDLADYGDATLAPWMDGEELVAIPFTNAGNVVFFNKDVFAAAGVPDPIELQAQGNWTWESLKETAAQIVTSGAAEYGFLSNNNIFTLGFRNMVEVWSAHGGAPWSADGKQCTFNSPEVAEATQLYWDMIFVDKSHPGPDVQAQFQAGNIGMAMGRSNQIGPALAGNDTTPPAPFAWDVTALPEGPAGFVPSRAQNGLAVFEETPNADLAAEWVIHTTIKENAAKFSKNSPSPRQSLANIETIAAVTSYLTEEQIERSIIPPLTSEEFTFEYSHANFAPIERNANLIFDGKIWVEDADIPAALEEVCAVVQTLMPQ